jgi:hypothetical protein
MAKYGGGRSKIYYINTPWWEPQFPSQIACDGSQEIHHSVPPWPPFNNTELNTNLIQTLPK